MDPAEKIRTPYDMKVVLSVAAEVLRTNPTKTATIFGTAEEIAQIFDELLAGISALPEDDTRLVVMTARYDTGADLRDAIAYDFTNPGTDSVVPLDLDGFLGWAGKLEEPPYGSMPQE